MESKNVLSQIISLLSTEDKAIVNRLHETALALGYIAKISPVGSNWLPYILNYYDYSISNGPTEGNNHKIKNIKRGAYGYRNTTNFELRAKVEGICA